MERIRNLSGRIREWFGDRGEDRQLKDRQRQIIDSRRYYPDERYLELARLVVGGQLNQGKSWTNCSTGDEYRERMSNLLPEETGDEVDFEMLAYYVVVRAVGVQRRLGAEFVRQTPGKKAVVALAVGKKVARLEELASVSKAYFEGGLVDSCGVVE